MEHRDDDDDNDDVSFAKWMSSFWGHSWRDKDERGLRDHQRLQEASYRKASLPCPKRKVKEVQADTGVHPQECALGNSTRHKWRITLMTWTKEVVGLERHLRRGICWMHIWVLRQLLSVMEPSECPAVHWMWGHWRTLGMNYDRPV